MAAIERCLDLDAIGTVHAVRYKINGDNGPWIVDGQHRITALIRQGLEDWPVSVMIHCEALDDKGASRLFLNLNDRAPVRVTDKFKNEVLSCDETALAITEIVESFGLRVSHNKSNKMVSGVNSLKRSYARDNGKSLRSALSVIIDAWRGDMGSLEGKLIEGLTDFFYQYGNQVQDCKGFVERLAKTPPRTIIGAAHNQALIGKGRIWQEISNRFVAIYNTKRSRHLIKERTK